MIPPLKDIGPIGKEIPTGNSRDRETKIGEYCVWQWVNWLYIHNKSLTEFKQQWMAPLYTVYYTARQPKTFKICVLEKRSRLKKNWKMI